MVYFWLKTDSDPPEMGFSTNARAVTRATGISAYLLRKARLSGIYRFGDWFVACGDLQRGGQRFNFYAGAR